MKIERRVEKMEYRTVKQDMAKCMGCGACYDVCPCGCFDSGGWMIEPERCGSCSQCIAVCASGALWFVGLRDGKGGKGGKCGKGGNGGDDDGDGRDNGGEEVEPWRRVVIIDPYDVQYYGDVVSWSGTSA